MKISENAYNFMDNQWKSIEFHWKSVKIHRISLKINEKSKNFIWDLQNYLAHISFFIISLRMLLKLLDCFSGCFCPSTRRRRFDIKISAVLTPVFARISVFFCIFRDLPEYIGEKRQNVKKNAKILRSEVRNFAPNFGNFQKIIKQLSMIL